MDLLAHLHQPATYGSEIRLEIERHWPGKCIPLIVKRHPEEFTLRFTESMPVEDATYEVVLPTGVDAYYEPIGFIQPDGKYSIKSSRKQGGHAFTFVAKSLPPDRVIGMRLEIRQ